MTNAKDLERMRAICGALDADFTEAPHFGGVVFKSGGKIFTSYGDKNGVVVQLESKHAAELLKDPRFERYARAKDTVMFDPAELESWAKVRALVAESHRLVLARSKKTKNKKTTTKKR